MAAVFAAAAQAPLTAIASVVEMTGNYRLMLPVMLAVAIATGLARRLSYGHHLHPQAPLARHRYRVA